MALFKDLSLEIIKKSVADERQAAGIERWELINKLVDFYEDEQQSELNYLAAHGFLKSKNVYWKDGDLNDHITQKFTNQVKIPLSTYNITKRVIDKISLIYKTPPERYLEEDEEGENTYQQWINDHPMFDLHMREAERYKNLCGKILHRIHYNKQLKKWRYFIETQYHPHFLEDDPLHPIGYSMLLKQNVYEVNNKMITDEQWVFWSDEYYFYFDNNGKVWANPDFPDMRNPFKRLPFVEMRKNVPVSAYDTVGALSLVDGNQAINIAINNINMMVHHQAFGQKYATGIRAEEADKVKWGPDTLITLTEPEASLGVLNSNPKIIESIEAVKFNIQAIAYMFNLNIDWSLEGAPASGFSLLVKNIDLLEAREDDVNSARVYEQEYYDIIQVQQEFYKGELPEGEVMLPKDGKVVVDFAEFSLPTNRQEEREEWDWKIEKNVRSYLDLIMEDNPDITDEDTAMEIYLKNKQINGSLTRADRLRMEVEATPPVEE